MILEDRITDPTSVPVSRLRGVKRADRSGPHTNQRAALVVRLRTKRARLDEVIRAHVENAIAPSYDVGGLCDIAQCTASGEAVDYGLSGIEHGERWAGPLPPACAAGARRAARHHLPILQVLDRYHAGQVKFAEIVMGEVEHGELMGQRAALRLVMEVQAVHDRLIAGIQAEYELERSLVTQSSEVRRIERIERLLIGASADSTGLGYEFEHHWHLCAVVLGSDATAVIAGLPAAVGCRLLWLARAGEGFCAWWASPSKATICALRDALREEPPAGVTLALGESNEGLEGWRLTHRQAQAAMRVVLHQPRPVTSFADVGIIAPWMHDPALARSFVDIHLAALGETSDGGAAARETLREYFRAGHQVAAAACALKIDRGTLRRRLAAIETRLGDTLCRRQAELEVALRLADVYGPRLHSADAAAS